MECDLLLFNGHISTSHLPQQYVKALAIKDGKILWSGNEWKGLSRNRLDLKNGFVFPGLVDAHIHLLYAGLVKSYLQLHQCPDLEAVLTTVYEKARTTPPGEWIIGVGWDDHLWPKKGELNAAAIDAVAPNHPVVLQRSDTHLLCVNSMMLKLAKINSETPNLLGGYIGKDPHGNPNGILIDLAMVPVRSIWPLPTLQERIEILRGFSKLCHQKGLTTVHNAATDQRDFEIFKYFDDRKELTLRIYGMATMRDVHTNTLIGQGPQTFSDHFQLRCLKFWMDGAMGSRGAALFEPYNDDPNNRGLLLWEEDQLFPLLEKAKKDGFQVAIHAIGDLAAHQVLNAYEKVGVQDLRWRVEHAQQLIPSDIPRFSKLGVIPSMQPLHEILDGAFLTDRLGKKRVKEGAFAWKQILENGSRIAGGSDAPVVDFNPLAGIEAASRTLTRSQALKMYTQDAAYASFQENEFGSIEEGKWADLAVFPKDLLTCSAEDLLEMDALYTIVGGKIVYAKNS